jgi:hypothetical protein
MFKFLKAIFAPFAWLFRILFGGGGSGGQALPKAPARPTPAAAPRVAGDDLERKVKKAQETHAVRSWIMSTLAAGDHAAMPPKLARDVKQWLPGLSTSQLEKLLDAGLEGIDGHIHGKRPVEDVPSLRPLPLAAIEPSARRIRPADVELSVDVETALRMCA